jgi:hypothetical protein
MKCTSNIFLNPNNWISTFENRFWADMVKDKKNRAIRHPVVVHIAGYEKY